jgi:tRNA 2-thiouridine synthesizing protein A
MSGTGAVLDARGLYCPVPVLRVRDRLRGMAPGAVLEVLADDPGTLSDFPDFCRSHGHRYLGHEPLERGWRFRLERGGGGGDAG